VWLGGNDDEDDDRWVWPDGVHFSQGNVAVSGSFVAWGVGEPNDDGGEDCLEMRTDGLWNDEDCDSDRAAVCELW
jgi:hypothetical protein